MADQFPMLSLTPDVPDPVAPSAAPAQSIQQQRWDLCITFLQNRQKEDSVMKKVIFIL